MLQSFCSSVSFFLAGFCCLDCFSDNMLNRFFVSTSMKSCRPIVRGVGLTAFPTRSKPSESLTANHPSKMPSKATELIGPSSIALMPFCLFGQLRE